MKFFANSKADLKKGKGTILLPFWESKVAEKAFHEKAFHEKDWDSFYQSPIVLKDFSGKEGEVFTLYPNSRERLILVGLGKKEKSNPESLRRSYGAAAKHLIQKKIKEFLVVSPEDCLSKEAIIESIAEGLLLVNYSYDDWKTESKEKSLLEKCFFYLASKNTIEKANEKAIIASGVYMARDLVNANADDITPSYLAELATKLAKKNPKLKSTILNKKAIEKEKLGLLLAVNRGSHIDPALITLSYKGNAKSKKHVVLIGKGITYDTGGLNLKPCASMESMKADMAGAAAVIATLSVIADLNLPINVTALVPATENSISSSSFKPGGVYKSASGLTVEVNNPDAEGRLVLADAVTYCLKHLHPTMIIDLATLTGGVDVALGSEVTGLFSNDDQLVDKLLQSGLDTYERVWRFPLYEEYKEGLKSDIADLKNSPGNRSASSIMGALFIEKFVDKAIPWAHLDIASTAFLDKPKRYLPKGATGIGVRLLVDFLRNLG